MSNYGKRFVLRHKGQSTDHFIWRGGIKSSYTPFLTENLYQSLRPFIPSDPKEDTRSIHFLSFPEVKAEYFDENIERQVQRMQAIIELTRNVRDRHTLSLKVGSSFGSCRLFFLTISPDAT